MGVSIYLHFSPIKTPMAEKWAWVEQVLSLREPTADSLRYFREWLWEQMAPKTSQSLFHHVIMTGETEGWHIKLNQSNHPQSCPPPATIMIWCNNKWIAGHYSSYQDAEQNWSIFPWEKNTRFLQKRTYIFVLCYLQYFLECYEWVIPSNLIFFHVPKMAICS